MEWEKCRDFLYVLRVLGLGKGWDTNFMVENSYPNLYIPNSCIILNNY